MAKFTVVTSAWVPITVEADSAAKAASKAVQVMPGTTVLSVTPDYSSGAAQYAA